VTPDRGIHRIGRVSNVTLCHEVPNFLFCLSTSGEMSCFIWLLNPLEGLLVRSYYSVCTSCGSFVNAFRHCTVLQRTALRSCVFLLPHAMVAAKPCITTQGFLCVLYVVIFVISLVLSHFKLLKP